MISINKMSVNRKFDVRSRSLKVVQENDGSRLFIAQGDYVLAEMTLFSHESEFRVWTRLIRGNDPFGWVTSSIDAAVMVLQDEYSKGNISGFSGQGGGNVMELLWQ